MSKGHSKNMFMRIMCSPIRALGKARDAYVRSITNCGQSMNYGSYPMDAASRFSSLSRSQTTSSRRSSSSSSLSRLDNNEDFAELVRAASARTLGNRMDIDLVLKQEQQKMNKKLPKSSSVGMAKIDEDMPFDSGLGNGVGFVVDSYPRSKSYAVGNRTRNGVF
ncbi:unnamed protein product [Lathyrus oleraceus]|uniref:Uncharacterized protein n=1 Tax=Pisum sativum TaxID=3888 RepID=A0A9D5A575_PEA|nr:uncharacterized protein LOC127098267 [Pisum sativum]KAI5393305.1 hypothetical protein KIW84_060430 [Pisum sativum]